LSIILLAVVFAGTAALLAGRLVNQEQAPPSVETLPVVVATDDIPRGTTIRAAMVRVRDCPKDLVPSGVFTRLEDVIDRVAFMPLFRGESVLEAKLAAKGSGPGMAGLTLRGMRTVTIQTNLSAGVAGFIMPGDKVDVLLTVTSGRDKDPSGGALTTRLLQNIEVVAVDQRLSAPADNKVDVKDLRSVTLLVAPDQDAMLALAQSQGTLHLSLRNSGDNGAITGKPVTLVDLRIRQEPPPEKKEKPVSEPVKVVTLKPPPQAPDVIIRTLKGSMEGYIKVGGKQPQEP
jgi:pilus assembly protein CpaB